MTRDRLSATHRKIRYTCQGTAGRPRISVYRSLVNIYAQAIDDKVGRTVASSSSLKISGSLEKKATKVGEELAKKLVGLKIGEAVFDRGGRAYHGAVKAIAEALRAGEVKI